MIQHFEQCRLTSYRDTKGRWAIGWGTNDPSYGPRMTVTQAEADTLLNQRISAITLKLNMAASEPMTQGRFDAMVDFAYNCGFPGLLSSGVWRATEAGDYAGAEEWFMRWIHGADKAGNMVELPNLVTRRRAEWVMYSTGAWAA